MANQIVVSAGAKVRNLQDVIIGTSGVLTSLGFDVANGVPRLDVNGKILVSQLPNSVMEYKGTWNAATNTPTLANGTGNQGDVYLCNVAGTVDFGAGAIAFVVGDQVIYSGSIWQRASGATGTVTSVGLTESGDSLNITGSPITTSGTINIGFNGTNLQYVNGAGNLTTFPTLITSIGLSMPSAFSVANSPLTANGTIAVTGAGVASQYIRGDGTLADFPSSGGGGSSVSYYLNGGTSQGTIGGTTYYEMSKTAVIGTGVDFSLAGDGFIVAFLTDANDPAQLNIPAGNWNYEIYASMSSNGGTPAMYAELYKYDGTTFTLISTSANEIIYDGTALNLYTFAMAVPATSLTLTDRLAVKIYATNSGGKTTTIHTQDGHLCQIITTFSTGITALNGLTAQVQYFQVGTSGTDFNISSTTATHTFNIPSASATNRGLITTGTQTIAGSKTFNATLYGTDSEFSGSVLSPIFSVLNGIKVVNLQSLATLNRDIYLPDASGTIALTSDIPSLAGYVTLATSQTITGAKTFSSTALFDTTTLYKKIGSPYITSAGYTSLQFTGSGTNTSLYITDGDSVTSNRLIFKNNAGYDYTFPAATGTIAMLEGTQTFTGTKSFGIVKFDGGVYLKDSAITSIISGYTAIGSVTGGIVINLNGSIYASTLAFNSAADFTYQFPSASGTIALTSNLASYVPYSGATGAVNLGAFDLTVNGIKVGIGGGSGANNTRLGSDTLSSLTTASNNIAVGANALFSVTSGNANVGIGGNALYALTTGTINTAIGFTAGSSITTGSYNTIVGKYVGTATLDSNVVLADGIGNIRFQWDGTNILLNGNIVGSNAYTSTAYLPLTGGTLTGALSGTSATFSSSLIVGSTSILYGNVAIKSNSATSYFGLNVIANGNNNFVALNHTGTAGVIETEFSTGGSHTPLHFVTGGSTRLTIASTGAATFTGNVGITLADTPQLLLTHSNTSRTFLMAVDGSNAFFRANSTNNLLFQVAGGTTALTIASSGAATFSSSGLFSGNLQTNAVLTIGNQFVSGNYCLQITPSTTTPISLQGILAGTGAANIVLQASGGNVGIGTSSPQSKLDVFGSGNTAINSKGNLFVSSGGTATQAAESGGQISFGAWLNGDLSSPYPLAAIRGVTESSTSNVNRGALIFGTMNVDTAVVERMRITSAGNVGIAVTPSSGIRLQVRAETSDSSSQAMNIGKANGADLIYVRADGYLYSVGAWSGSDIRLKENITDLDNGLQKVLGLKAKKFDLIDGLKNNFGFIAQEMQEVIPDAVSVFEEKEQLLAVRMDFIIPHLVKAIQEQQAQIEELKQLITE